MKEDKIIIDSLKEIKDAKEYWLNICSKPMEKLLFPRDFFGEFQYNKKTFNFVLNGDLYNKLSNITNEENLTIYTLLLSVFEIGLFKYNMQNDLIIGIPVYFKSNQENSLNKVILTRNYLEDNMTFKQVLLDLRKTIIEACKNQLVSLEEIVKLMNVDKDIMSLLPINFAMKNIHSEEHIEYIVNSPKNEITFLIEKVNNAILFEVIFNSKLFKIDTIQRFCDIYSNILYQVLNNLEVRLFEIEMLSEEENHKILYDFNNTYADYPRDKTIHELFEEQVEKTPNNIAVVYAGIELTYRELNDKSNSLAGVLRGKGVKSDSIVGIMVERSLEMMVGIMGILKAGGAYLPIDPEYPQDRIEYMLEDSNTQILLTQSHLMEKVRFDGIVINLENKVLYEFDKCNLEKVNNSSDLAYVIYTSGSTGKPKGVMVEHRSAINFIIGVTNQIQMNENESILALTTISFDIFFLETVLSVTKGLKVIIVDSKLQKDANELSEFICENNINIIQATPSRIQLVANSDKGLSSLGKVEKLLVGGEPLSQSLFEELKKLKLPKLYNMYGPTETTVWSSIKDLTNSSNVNIGKPIMNTGIYIMNKDNKIQPIGVAGELCISGVGLARGYLNNLELTAEKFIKNPFVSGDRMYKTGDLARWLPDGNIEFIGRIDHQVKIRGFRIELGEIESQLLAHELVKEAVVIDKEDEDGNKYLCAYIVSEEELKVSELREHLSRTLTEYMMPSYFIQIEKMKLTPNGKVDRKALLELDGKIKIGVEYESPRNEVEAKLVRVWEEVLGVDKIGINDNFFELGGHSLKATVLVSRIHKELDAELSLGDIYNLKNVKSISEYISTNEKVIYKGIKKADKKSYYPVTPNQKGLFIANKNNAYNAESNVPIILNIEGVVNKDKLQKVLIELINRHDAFRTSFEVVDEEVACIIHENVEFKLEYKEHIGEDINGIIKDFIKHFDLNSYPLMRALLLKIDGEKYTLIIDIHHIVIDGYSLNILYKELVYLYVENKLEAKEYDMRDYLVTESEFMEDEKMKGAEQYWKDKFSDGIKSLNIPYDLNDFKMDGYKGETVEITISTSKVHRLTELANNEKTTLHTVMFALYAVLLSQYSGENEIVIGSISAGRRLPEYKDIIGSFINLIPIMNRIDKEDTFIEFVNKTNENLISSYENQYFPFHKLQIDKSINTLLNFHTEQEKNEGLIVDGLKFEFYDNLNNNQANLDIQVDFVIMHSEGIKCIFEYNANKFKQETIKRMKKHFMNIIDQIINYSSLKIREIKALSIEEERQIVNDFNDTFVNYDKDVTIHRMFEKQVKKTPDSIAMEYYNEKITYSKLNEKANALARKLRELGVKAESIVGIKVDRSIEMMIGLMAILKAGGAYLPIDPEYPTERSKFMIADSSTKIILTQQKFLKNSDIDEFDGIIVELGDDELYKGDSSNLGKNTEPHNLSYIIYTSGSTGKPKGVMVEHRNVVAYINAFCHEYKISDQDVILQQASYGFDTSVEELYPVLTVGGKLIITTRSDIKDMTKLITLIEEYKITIISASPLLIYAMNEMELGKGLRLVISGGDVLKKEYISNIIKGRDVYNTYGPTESTVCATYYKCSENLEDNIPIGKPIANYSVYILSTEGKIQPIGLPGELCVSGLGITRGYLNQEELTKERFIENSVANGQRMYKTGDLARWLPNGNIEYLGRIDNQIKIRGYRVELEEIEQVILRDSQIKDVTVVYSDDVNDNQYICAYIVSDINVNIQALKRKLYMEIPSYMIPQFFIQVENMPMNVNGKLDKKRLPVPKFERTKDNEYLEPRNDVEKRLCVLVSEVLKVDSISINDNLFDLGADSLKLIIILPKIQKEFDVKVSIEDIFSIATIKEICGKIMSLDKSKYSAISRVEEREYYPLASAQKRLYMLNQLDPKSTSYNIPIAVKIKGALDILKVQKAFYYLIDRHEILRTTFKFQNNDIVQKVNDKIDFLVEYDEVDNLNFEFEDFQKNFIRPFNLENGPLIRVKITKLYVDEFILQIDMHHIISDGQSVEILINEFNNIYLGNEVPESKIQYRDFAVWQDKMFKEGNFKDQEEYWLNMYRGSIPKLNMPLDYKKLDIQSFEGDKVSFEIDEELVGKIKRICEETATTMYMVLFVSYATLLANYTSDEDMIIGVPVLGRSHSDLEKVIGMFVNTLAIRVYPEANKTFKEFLYEVKNTLLKSFEYQEFELDRLIEALKLERTTSGNPFFNTIFNFRTNNQSDTALENMDLGYMESNNKISKFDFSLNAFETKENIYFEIEYCTKLFSRKTIERLSQYYVKVLSAVSENIDIYLNEIELEDFEIKEVALVDVEFNF